MHRKQKRSVLPGEGRLQPHKRSENTSGQYSEGQSPTNLTCVWKTQAVGTPRIAYNIISVAKTQTTWTPRVACNPTSVWKTQAVSTPRVAYKLTSVSKTQAVSTPWVAYNLTSVAKTQTVWTPRIARLQQRNGIMWLAVGRPTHRLKIQQQERKYSRCVHAHLKAVCNPTGEAERHTSVRL